MSKQLEMLIGLPRSGKSTWASNHKNGRVIVSADDFRSVICGKRYHAAGEQIVWATRDIAFKVLLAQGIDIIVDETNTTVAIRANIIKLAKSYGYEVNARWFPTSVDTCVKRAKDTEQEDLIPVIYKMAEKEEIPTKNEGFDSIQVAGLQVTLELKEREDI